MEEEYNIKRVNPPLWQHDYHVLKRLYENLEEIVKKYCIKKKRGGVVLDYGCGTMPYKNLFLPFASRYIGVDVSGNHQASILVKEGKPIPLANASIDVIVSTQVLEHIENASFYLSECRRLLKKGGLLLLSTHGVWPYHPHPADFHRWTKKGLVAKIRKSGFRCLEINSILGPFASITQFTSLVLAERLIGKGPLGKTLLAFFALFANGIIWLEDRLFPASGNSDSSVYVACAEKL